MLQPVSQNLLTADEFIDRKFDFPEGGRWTELHAGVVVTFEPPDDRHGNFVRNLSRVFAEFSQRQEAGYACFELGFILQQQPATIYSPPVSYITSGDRFAETDAIATSRVPVLVVEIASTNDRRRSMNQRVEHYLSWKIPTVWVADPLERVVHVFSSEDVARQYQGVQILPGGEGFEEFQTPVAPLFTEPEWWTSAIK